MPIYCLNGTQSARKRSKNIMHELVANNYYMNNTQQLSMASYHILVSKNKSLSATSLMMVINRFKNSVKNMKDTVLIPTRLSDLVCSDVPEELSDLDEQNEQPTVIDNGDQSDGGCCRALSPVQDHFPLLISAQHSNSSTFSMSETSSTVKSHNLFEQYNLLNVIDKILSSDATLTVSSQQRQCSRSASIVLHASAFENDDNNNSKQANGQEESVKFNNGHTNGDSHAHVKRHSGGKTVIGHNACRNVRSSSVTIENGTNGHELPTNGHGIGCENGHASGGDNITNCSLLKIKDKLEYHLISLKNILTLMSNSADYITQKYLEDIQCEDRFAADKQAKSCDQQQDVIRHYYTSNNNASAHF